MHQIQSECLDRKVKYTATCISSEVMMMAVHYAACGEPPMCMSCSVLFAVKRAIESVRADIKNHDLVILCEY